MRYLVVPLLVLFAPLCLAEANITGKNCTNKYGAKLVSLQGKLFFDPDSKGHWQLAQLNETICEGSRVRVEPYSRASLLLSNGIILRLDAGTVLSLNSIAPNKPTLLDLLKGFVHFISRTPRRLEISSPIANAGPEGTEFAMSVDESKASLWVYEGGVKFFNNKGSIHLNPGQGAQAHLGQAPQAKIDINPQDAVNWALYYPPVLPYPDAATVIDSDVRKAIQDFRQGHVDVALTQLDALSAEQQTPYFHKVRGAMRLTAGQDKLALQDIQALLTTNPNDAEALALQSVRALTQNRKEEAYALANRAIVSNPQSASAYTALSYAEQGRFQLDKAQASADQAVKLAPHDAMVWARKAELELSQGLTSESKKAAQKATELDASLERTQTVMGFSYLLRMDTDEALKTFEKALQLDSTSPLARLGLGLAKIRKGDLEEGRRDLEIAAILDPNNSLIRSYLGKAYYEEKRNSLSEDQYKLAKERDPNDPTPYFYDAIKKQTENKPIAALQDLQKSIELNDNRATYRSKLALDSDLAARSSSLSRVYRDIGFSQLALVEGWKSVNSDPTDYSAHRLLADSYSTRSFYDIARVSELLQSQLLQPINTTPIQPQLGEKNLLALDSTGPAISSFNEFNPLFTRNRFALQTSAVAGSNDTYGDEVVHSGLWRNFSYSIGQYHFESNGFRENNDVHIDLVNAFVQASITPNFSVQSEYRHRELERGDIDLIADGEFFSDLRIRSISDSYRAGLHYTFNQKSDLIASFIHLDGDNFSKNSPDTKFDLENVNGNQGEIQHLFRSDFFSAVTGFGFSQTNTSKSSTDTSISHANGYLYTYTHYPREFDWTLGISVDSLDDTSSNPIKIEQVNPKLGMIWRAMKGTTLRMALSRSLKRSLITNQTIEPTQVAGFNQFFDDYLETDAWLYGIAVDQKFSRQLFGGLEFIARDLSRPENVTDENTKLLGNKSIWHERNYRTYLNWNLTSKLAANFSFHLEEFEGDGRFSVSGLAPLSTTTYDGKAGLRFFDPSGFFCNVEAEYVNQRTDWPGLSLNETLPASLVFQNEFALVNAGIGFRLPRRLGIIQLDINNIFDKHFNYQSLGPRSPAFAGNGQTPPFIPERTLFARFTLAF
jgi:Tfp pilus assembly protein PilF